MLRLLQTNQIKSYATALIIFGIIQAGNWLMPTAAITDLSNISTAINALNYEKIIALIAKAIVLIIAGLALQASTIRNEVIYKNTTLVFFFYLIFNSIIPQLSFFSSFTILGLILVLIFRQIVLLYNHPNPNYTLFSSGILIGIGTIIEPVFAISILFIAFGFTRFVPFNIKSASTFILGITFPAIILGSAVYYNPDLLKPIITLPELVLRNVLDHYQTTIIISVLLLTFLGAFWWSTNLSRNTVKSRRIIQTILFSFINLGLLALFTVGKNIHALELISLPASLCLAYYFSSSKKPRLRNALLLLLLLGILFVQYHHLFFL